MAAKLIEPNQLSSHTLNRANPGPDGTFDGLISTMTCFIRG
jgi:hypothetical protein